MKFRPGTAEGREEEFDKAREMGENDRPTYWRDLARCRNLDTEDSDVMFFPPRNYEGSPSARANLQRGINFCEPCQVRVECLSIAARRPSIEGVWGGWSHEERKQQFRRLKVRK